MDRVVYGLVQPPPSQQRHQVRDALTASQWSGRGDLPAPGRRLRARASANPTPLVTIDAVLASNGGGLDQSTTTRSPTHTNYICHGCLNSSRCAIFPDSHRSGRLHLHHQPAHRPEALLRLIRVRWSIESWHLIRDTQLHEDKHRYRDNGAGVLATLRTAALNLLRLAGFDSIREDLHAVSTKSQRHWQWRCDSREKAVLTL
jgi:hypothetical protein